MDLIVGQGLAIHIEQLIEPKNSRQGRTQFVAHARQKVGLGPAGAFGLGAGVWTRDVKKAHRVSGALRSGTVWINCYLQMDPSIPFGGYRMSGYGREFGTRHIDEFMQLKSVVLDMG